MSKFVRWKIELATAPLLCAFVAVSNQTIAQERVYAVKGGDTMEVYPVWWVAHCKSILTATPVVEVLEGPSQIKLWVEPAMVEATRLKCPSPVAGGKLMAKIGAVENKTEAKITFRVLYQTKEGEHQIARAYNITMFPGEEKPGPSEASRSWQAFLTSAGLTTDNKAAHLPPSSSSKSKSARQIVKRHKLIRVASADNSSPITGSREQVYAQCRHRIHAKYGWKADGRNWMWREQSLGMTDYCVTHGGKVP